MVERGGCIVLAFCKFVSVQIVNNVDKIKRF